MLSMLAAGVNGETVVNPIKRKVVGSTTVVPKSGEAAVTTKPTVSPNPTTIPAPVPGTTAPTKFPTTVSPNPANVQTVITAPPKVTTTETTATAVTTEPKKMNPLFLIGGASLLLYFLFLKK